MGKSVTFGPSLAISVLVNVAVFAALQPIQVAAVSRAKPRFQLHRLQRLADLPTTPPETAEAPPALEPPAARDRRAPGEAGGARRATRPSGGDGTSSRLLRPRAGGGDPADARPRESGRRRSAPLPGLGPEPPAAPAVQMAQAPAVVDGPPIIMPGSGAYGGTGFAPTAGRVPAPGVAGSGDLPRDLAPATTAGFTAPLAPTTPGPRLRDKAGPGLPEVRDAPTVITAADVVAGGRSGGGGGMARLPGVGGGGPALRPDDLAAGRTRGGGGSGLDGVAEAPGGGRIGHGPGGTGGGGNGLAPVGGGGAPTLSPATGRGSIVSQDGFGEPGPPVRPGPRGAGPGGPPSPTPAAMPTGPVGDGGGRPAGHGSGDGNGGGSGTGGGRGDGHAAASRGSGSGGGVTGVVIDTLALRWHHIPGSYDLHIGSIEGPRLATIGIIRFPSVGAARASDRVARDGHREVLVIRPLAIRYVEGEGRGARQRVAISADDAAKLRASGLLQERDRIVTVYKSNY